MKSEVSISAIGTDPRRGEIWITNWISGTSTIPSVNALGYLTRSIDRAGRPTDYTYAPTKKLTSITRYLNEGGTRTPVKISYCFDKMFNSLSITNPSTDAVETYQLDLRDRVHKITNIEGQAMDIGKLGSEN